MSNLVWIQFKDSGRGQCEPWEKQFDFSAGEKKQVTAKFANSFIAAERAEFCEAPSANDKPKKEEESDDGKVDLAALAGETVYTQKGLKAMTMPDLREIGDQFDVKDNKKDDLIVKILDAQEKLETEEASDDDEDA